MSSRYIKQKEPEPRRCFFCHTILLESHNDSYFCCKAHAYAWAVQEADRIARKYHPDWVVEV